MLLEKRHGIDLFPISYCLWYNWQVRHRIKGPPHPLEKFAIQVPVFLYALKKWNISMHLTWKWREKCSILEKKQLLRITVFHKSKIPSIIELKTYGLVDWSHIHCATGTELWWHKQFHNELKLPCSHVLS